MLSDKLEHQVGQQFLSHDIIFMSLQCLHCTITVKHLDSAKDGFLASLPAKYCDMAQHFCITAFVRYINCYKTLILP